MIPPVVTEQRFCEACGNELGPDAAFCGSCGTPIRGAAHQAERATRAEEVEPRPDETKVSHRGRVRRRIVMGGVGLALAALVAVVLALTIVGGSSGQSAEHYRHEFCGLIASGSSDSTRIDQLARRAADLDPTYELAANTLKMLETNPVQTGSGLRAVDETCRQELTAAGINVDNDERTAITRGP
jgi:hypothetical protein